MLKVIQPGLYTTVQDRGRFQFAQYGVPMSGCMDQTSADLANLLVNNSSHEALLEITLLGSKLEFFSDTCIAITGADLSPKINDVLVPMNKAMSIKKGDVLSFGQRNYGARAYVAISGGFKTLKVLGSRSFYRGITKDVVLQKHQELLYESITTPILLSSSSVKANLNHFQTEFLEVFKGPEFDLLTATQQKQLLQTKFTISKDQNRMGVRLEETIENNLDSIITSLVMPGTVQLTPSGQLIVLMKDAQTTGGYPRVLQLTEKAVNQLAQKWVGGSISFTIH